MPDIQGKHCFCVSKLTSVVQHVELNTSKMFKSPGLLASCGQRCSAVSCRCLIACKLRVSRSSDSGSVTRCKHYLLAVIRAARLTTLSLLPFVIPLQRTLSVAFLRLTTSNRPSAPPSGSPKCLRFGHWLTLCTINIHLLTYLLKTLHWH